MQQSQQGLVVVFAIRIITWTPLVNSGYSCDAYAVNSSLSSLFHQRELLDCLLLNLKSLNS